MYTMFLEQPSLGTLKVKKTPENQIIKKSLGTKKPQGPTRITKNMLKF
jgi:hypothetical protein